MKRGQTSTEYIILVAVVIVIAVVVSSILGDFPGIGSGTTKKIDDFKLSTSKVAIDDYGTVGSSTLVKIRNNHFDTLVANSLLVNGQNCDADLPTTLNVGQSVTLNCSGLILEEGVMPEIQIEWKDVSTDASYTEGETSELINYNVTYYANGATSGTVPTESTEYISLSKVTVLGSNDLSKDLYSFVSWNTQADGSGIDYSESETFTISSNIDLYAIWERTDVTCEVSGTVTDPGCWSDEAPIVMSFGPGVDTTSNSETNGLFNQGEIITTYWNGSSWDNSNYPASTYCHELTEGSVSQGTWYLPAKDQLWNAYSSVSTQGLFRENSNYRSSTEFYGNPTWHTWTLYVGPNNPFSGATTLSSDSKLDSSIIRCLR